MPDEVHKVTIQIRAPRGRDPGAVAEGWYCVVDDAVVLTDADGKPIGAKRELSPGDDAHLIACRMVRNQGRNSSTSFNRPISYPKSGLI